MTETHQLHLPKCPLSGVKRTCLTAISLSANDPKRTFAYWCPTDNGNETLRKPASPVARFSTSNSWNHIHCVLTGSFPRLKLYVITGPAAVTRPSKSPKLAPAPLSPVI